MYRAARSFSAALVALAALVAPAGCDDTPLAPRVDVPDASASCERGTRGCACMGGSGCRDDLLCIAGRCQLTEGPREMAPPAPPRPRPEIPDVPELGAPDASGPSTLVDASSPPGAPDAAADPPDAAGDGG